MFDKLIETLKATKRTIVFTEGEDARILEAADKLLKGGFLGVVLVGTPEDNEGKLLVSAWCWSAPRPA